MNVSWFPRDCQRRGCNGELFSLPEDPALPPHVEHVECDACGEWFLYDTEDATLEVDA